MNIIYLILVSQLLLVEGNDNAADERLDLLPAASSYFGRRYIHQPASEPSLLLDHLELKVTDKDKTIVIVNLQPTKQILANENLPIWILKGAVDSASLDNKDGDELQRNYEVMEQLGEFTAYQQPETLSSAIYYHKRRQFDGMIGYEFIIHKLSVDKIHSTKLTTIELNQSGIYYRPAYEGHKSDHPPDEYTSGVNDQKRLKTYEGRVYDGYPEVLVIVSNDVINKLIENVDETDLYTTVVSYVLTMFNGIDMLYSQLKRTKIQVNIAGIIMEVEAESLSFLNDCYRPEVMENKMLKHKLEGSCVNRLFRRYLSARKEKIPIDSYDMVIYLTNEIIHVVYDDNELGITSASSNVMLDIYRKRKHDTEVILVGTVTNVEYMGTYPIIAHEMAHLMTVLHDEHPFFTNYGECCGSILKTGGEWCKTCMTWSETSEETFNLFFSSPNCCAFINKPRSLQPPGYYQMLTADEQCRCYGFEYARKFRHVFNNFCRKDLQCGDDGDSFHHTVIPMDGTPCHNNKVCYGRQCRNVEIPRTVIKLK